MDELHTREVRSSKSMLFYAILGLGLGDSMHEPHKGSEQFQIYVVFNAILGLGLGDSMHELHKEVRSSKSMFFMPFWV